MSMDRIDQVGRGLSFFGLKAGQIAENDIQRVARELDLFKCGRSWCIAVEVPTTCET